MARDLGLVALEVEADVAQFLAARQQPEESLCDVLRRLLGIPREGEVAREGEVQRTQLLTGGDFWRRTTVIGRLLSVLRSLYLQNPARFEGVLVIRGRSRVFFARTAQGIEKSGYHTYPRQIPDSPFWVCSNLNKWQKRVLLHRVLEMMGYTSKRERWSVVNALTDGINPRPRWG